VPLSLLYEPSQWVFLILFYDTHDFNPPLLDDFLLSRGQKGNDAAFSSQKKKNHLISLERVDQVRKK
jgi:hypothetical protein